MASILPTYDWTKASAHIENARSRVYPWDEWLDGQIRKLDRGPDFDGPAMSVERVIRTSANRRGIRVRIRVEGESIYLQAHLDNARNSARGVTKSATKKAVKEAAVAKAEGRGNGVAPSDVLAVAPAPTKVGPVKATPVNTGPVVPSTNGKPRKAVSKASTNGKATTTAAPRRKLVKA